MLSIKQFFSCQVFLLLARNICCGYSLEASRGDASNECRNKCFEYDIRKILRFLLENMFLIYC